MSRRDAHRARRAANRKAKKAEMRRQTAAQLKSESGFVSQNPPPPNTGSGFVSQKAPQLTLVHSSRSAGPRTAPGKLASSRNSFKHGLATGQRFIPGEDPAEFEALHRMFLDDRRPANAAQAALVEQMAHAWWLSQRALRLQETCFTETAIDEKRLSVFLRYGATHDRAFHKALAELLRLQKEYPPLPDPQPERSSAAQTAIPISQSDDIRPMPPPNQPQNSAIHLVPRPSPPAREQPRNSKPS